VAASASVLLCLQVKQQLVQSQKQAETAMAAEAAARAELQSLQQQLERHKEEARAQAEAFEAAKMQLLALKFKAAENRECLMCACVPI
jgi:chromosome segregation ATPase